MTDVLEKKQLRRTETRWWHCCHKRSRYWKLHYFVTLGKLLEWHNWFM